MYFKFTMLIELFQEIFGMILFWYFLAQLGKRNIGQSSQQEYQVRQQLRQFLGSQLLKFVYRKSFLHEASPLLLECLRHLDLYLLQVYAIVYVSNTTDIYHTRECSVNVLPFSLVEDIYWT